MRAETITKVLGGRWHGRYGTARCPAHDDATPSLSIADGEDGRILFHCFAGCEFAQIRDAINCLAGSEIELPNLSMPSDRKTLCSDPSLLWLVNKIWAETVPIEASLAEDYLRARGIASALPKSLRFHKQLRHPSGDRLPAMVARVERVGGGFSGLHRTYLELKAPAQADRRPAKMMLGACKGGAVHLREGSGSLTIAEGIETALSLGMGLDAGAAVWAALSTSGMAGLHLPDPITYDSRLLVATDGDSAGQTAGRSLAQRAVAQGWRVEVVSAPDGYDFNDLLAGVDHG